MRTRLSLKPGQRGTKKLLRKYGARLVRVRYRYDAARRKRYKTVELIVDEVPWEPAPEREEIVAVRVAYEEFDLRRRVKAAGGRGIRRTSYGCFRGMLRRAWGWKSALCLPEKHQY